MPKITAGVVVEFDQEREEVTDVLLDDVLLNVLYAYACPLSSPKMIDTSESYTDDVDVANDEFAS